MHPTYYRVHQDMAERVTAGGHAQINQSGKNRTYMIHPHFKKIRIDQLHGG